MTAVTAVCDRCSLYVAQLYAAFASGYCATRMCAFERVCHQQGRVFSKDRLGSVDSVEGQDGGRMDKK